MVAIVLIVRLHCRWRSDCCEGDVQHLSHPCHEPEIEKRNNLMSNVGVVQTSHELAIETQNISLVTDKKPNGNIKQNKK